MVALREMSPRLVDGHLDIECSRHPQSRRVTPAFGVRDTSIETLARGGENRARTPRTEEEFT
jgi:hypothetical protein